MRNTWQLQEAKNHLSVVVEKALRNGAQIITRHGKPVVVMVSVADYRKLRPDHKRLVGILRACPVRDLDWQRMRDVPRDLAL